MDKNGYSTVGQPYYTRVFDIDVIRSRFPVTSPTFYERVTPPHNE